jgi:hypothetical protein
VVLALAALAAGCSSSGKSPGTPITTTTTTSTTGAGVPSGATAIGNGAVPVSPVSAVMAPFRTKGKPFSSHEYGFTPGNRITATWYRMGNVWAVHFKGLTQATGAGKCAISALETSDGRKDATETPYGQGTCAEFTDKVLPPGSLVRCADKIFYKTQIPLTARGKLTAILGRGYIPDGSVEGIRSSVTADAARAPLIAPSVGCYVVA